MPHAVSSESTLRRTLRIRDEMEMKEIIKEKKEDKKNCVFHSVWLENGLLLVADDMLNLVEIILSLHAAADAFLHAKMAEFIDKKVTK